MKMSNSLQGEPVDVATTSKRMLDLSRTVVLRRRLISRRRNGCELSAQALENFSQFYDHTMQFYRLQVSEEQDSQTPILDAILRFLQFLDESGMLDLLLKLLFGLHEPDIQTMSDPAVDKLETYLRKEARYLTDLLYETSQSAAAY